MPIGIVTNEDFERELSKCNHVEITRGRGSIKEVPEIIREIIAEDALLSDKTNEEVAKEHGVSTQSVSAYKHGATSLATYNEPDRQLVKKTDEIRNNIIGTARSRLISALQNITPEKLADAKLRDVASVAKDMSAVIRNTEPQVSSTQIGAQFVFHVPKQKSESDYEIIDVG